MKTSLLAASAFAALLLSGCVTDAPRTSLRPGGTYDPDARVRAAEMESDRPVIIVPYGMYGYPGPYYYGGGFGYGAAYGYGAPWYGGYYGPGPVYVPPRHHHRPAPPTNGQVRPNNPPRTFRDLFPGAKR